jgi:hypothetical protein
MVDKPNLYQDKYRIESSRLKGWDYGSSGYYFVTLCCEDRRSWFGTVKDGEVVLSDSGKTAS